MRLLCKCSQINSKRDTIGQPEKHHSMVFLWFADSGPRLLDQLGDFYENQSLYPENFRLLLFLSACLGVMVYMVLGVMLAIT